MVWIQPAVDLLQDYCRIRIIHLMVWIQPAVGLLQDYCSYTYNTLLYLFLNIPVLWFNMWFFVIIFVSIHSFVYLYNLLHYSLCRFIENNLYLSRLMWKLLHLLRMWTVKAPVSPDSRAAVENCCTYHSCEQRRLGSLKILELLLKTAVLTTAVNSEGSGISRF